MLFLITSLFTLTSAQECVYRVGTTPIELDLYALKGQRYGFTSDDGTRWAYSPCYNGFECSHDGKTVAAMVDHEPNGVNECFPWASMDSSVQPYYDFGVASFIFNYSNGERCPDGTQINRTATILWTCDEDVGTPRLVDAFHADECNVIMEVKWSGACTAPRPDNEDCEFNSGLFGGAHLNLSMVKGKTFSLKEENQNGQKFTYEFTPCANGIKCDSAQSGYSANVMADIRDSGDQCAKFLGVWSGDAQPFYDRTALGQDYWDFFWMDGEECGAGNPLESLNVRYYCNPKVRPGELEITKAFSSGPCQFRMEIDTVHACKNASDYLMLYDKENRMRTRVD